MTVSAKQYAEITTELWVSERWHWPSILRQQSSTSLDVF